MLFNKMNRVNKANPCPICGKPDWCLAAPDDSAAICTRIEHGSVKRCGDAGWLHRLNDSKDYGPQRAKRFTMTIAKSPKKDFTALTGQYRQQLEPKSLSRLSCDLGVSTVSLQRLEIGWNGTGFTFPMKDHHGHIIGIRIRYPDNHKVCVKGSKQGLFIPHDLPEDGLLLVCEGTTDCTAALDLGFAAIGRPSCNSGVTMLSKLVRMRDIVIAADTDEAGRKGAADLATVLVLHCETVRIIYPPAPLKDLRQWKQNGLDREKLQSVINKSECISIGLSIKTRKGKSNHG